MSLRRAVTLIELLVAITLLGILSGVTTLALRRIDTPNAHDPRAILADSIRVVLQTGRSATVHLVIDGVASTATIHPDGRVIADSLLILEPLSGTFARAR